MTDKRSTFRWTGLIFLLALLVAGGAALAAEIAGVVDLGPELLRRVSSAARFAERHRMIRTRLEEQRSESDEQQHDVRIVVLEARDCQAGRRNSSVEGVDLVNNSRMTR